MLLLSLLACNGTAAGYSIALRIYCAGRVCGRVHGAARYSKQGTIDRLHQPNMWLQS